MKFVTSVPRIWLSAVLLVVLLASASYAAGEQLTRSGVNNGVADQPVADHMVEVRSDFYTPSTLTIDAGDRVIWQRVDGFHSVTADESTFDQPAGNAWNTFSHTFTIPGEYLYYCTAHGGPDGVGMAGKVIVRAPDNGEGMIYLPYLLKQ
jgi:plastocyanin